MCGIAGYFRRARPDNETDVIKRMARSIRHRGPDDEGFALINTMNGHHGDFAGAESDLAIKKSLPSVDAAGFPHDIAFAHTRYSIVELSPAGHQPMWSMDGSVCVSFNGEIYNYLELRAELEKSGSPFKTFSDTEVIINGYLTWGTGVFARLNGPMALALYDSRRSALLFARDRVGKSPLYYAVKDGVLYWASEIKAILGACGNAGFPVRAQAVDDYVVHSWRDLDGTFWQGIEDFPPASFAWAGKELSLKMERYWSLPAHRLGIKDISPGEATDRCRELITDAVRLRLRADVPVGFELSGGMDSSAVVALAAKELPERIKTFTIKFKEEHSDEEPYARSLAELYPAKIDYNVIYPGSDDFWTEADEFIRVEEEPFHSPNLHTNQALRRTIRSKGIKVVITGSAGDEVLAGYHAEYYLPFLRHLLRRGRGLDLLREIRSNTENSSLKTLVKLFIGSDNANQLRSRTKRLLKGVYANNEDIKEREKKRGDFEGRMLDNMTGWMMNYWLRSGNKATFGIPIEARSPFLDYRVVDFAFTLPPEYLIRDGWHKWVLRQATRDILPEKIVWRKNKMGFPFPWREWLANSKPIIERNLKGTSCPYIDVKGLMRAYDDINRVEPQALWRVICLGLWWRRMVEGRHLECQPRESVAR